MKTKKYYDVRGFLKDATLTILHLPVDLVICIFAAFAQCAMQLKYDVTNNIHEAYRE